MTTPIHVVGNWKMNSNKVSSLDIAKKIAACASQFPSLRCIICPPFTFIAPIASRIKGSTLSLGAQNLHYAPHGAFTGEVSASMLKELVRYVIIGHSERRFLFGESNKTVAKKLIAASEAGISPILCVGETKEARKTGEAVPFIRSQLTESTDGFTAWGRLLVAYEAVWAIGADGQPASPAQADQIASVIRQTLQSLAGSGAESIPVLYGGNVTSINVGPFIDRPNIQGVLVGGASLKPEEFCKIIRIASSIPKASDF